MPITNLNFHPKISDISLGIFSQLMEPEVGNIVQWKTRRFANELITGLKCMPNILAVIFGKINVFENDQIKFLRSSANIIPKQDVQDFIDRCKRIRKQDAFTHSGNNKQPVVLAERYSSIKRWNSSIIGKKRGSS
jgi:hypothetical protein